MPVIPATTTAEPGIVIAGGALNVPRTLPVKKPGNGPETAEIDTPTYNAVLPGSRTGTVLTGALPEAVTPGNVRMVRGPALSPWTSLQGRLRETGITPLSAVRTGMNRIPPKIRS